MHKVPSETWQNAFELVPEPAAHLRKALFNRTALPASAALAKACLIRIDELRDDYGLADGEPRHPDLASGRPWPVSV